MSSQNLPNPAASPRLTLRHLRARYEAGEKLTMLTAYDFVTAALLDRAGIEMLLVGDSLGNVVLGYETTIPVTLDQMIHHTAAVVRGTQQAFVICDLPFGTTRSPEAAVDAAIRVFQETGCHAVKLEGGAEIAPAIRKLVQNGIPVMAHIGLTPQSIHTLGGFYKHGKTPSDISRLREAALAVQDAGAFAVVLECVVETLAEEITRELWIPTIGIGSGSQCSGQVLVINDLIGLSVRPAPKFARPRADVAGVITQAATDFLNEVKDSPPEIFKEQDPTP